MNGPHKCALPFSKGFGKLNGPSRSGRACVCALPFAERLQSPRAPTHPKPTSRRRIPWSSSGSCSWGSVSSRGPGRVRGNGP
jgi:hypothetical protein